MPDLSIEFCGVKAPNPFWLASAPPTNSEYQVRRAFEAGWGGAVWKTYGFEPIVNTVMHYFFDKYWDHPRAQATRQAIARVAQQAVPHTPHRTRQQEGPEAGRAVGA